MVCDALIELNEAIDTTVSVSDALEDMEEDHVNNIPTTTRRSRHIRATLQLNCDTKILRQKFGSDDDISPHQGSIIANKIAG